MNGEPLVVLLVEDNAEHAELVKRSFARHRVANRLIHVADGEHALRYLRREAPYQDRADSPTPSVVLLDLRLPRIGGLDVLKTIKSDETLQRIPVVILTSSEAESDMARAYECHANSYVTKPLDFAKFTQLMDSLGFYWLAWNRRPE